jgi:CPA1 family monovalent cation:H+ antiporter
MVAEEVHGSGVLAVVGGGLLLSHNRHAFLSSTSRLRGVNVWESFCFLLNGLVFMLIGLDLPEIVAGLGGVGLWSAIGYGVLVTFVLIIGRILSSYGAVLVTLVMRNFITVADTRSPGFKVPLVLGWTGMRGVVSLAAALSIPLQLENGLPFPQRNLILFITFIVILLTLLLQGLTLPYLIKRLIVPNMDEDLPEEEVDRYLRKALAAQALSHLNRNYTTELGLHPVLQQLAKKWEHTSTVDSEVELTRNMKAVYLDILDQQRKWLINKNSVDTHLDEDIVRKHLRLLDLEEEKLQHV